MKISVVIPFYKGNDFLSACLSSLKNSQLPNGMDLSVIIVDNCPMSQADISTVGSDLSVQVVTTRKAIGFGRACNAGAAKAVESTADIIVILNQDTKLGEHTLANMARFLKEQKHPLTVAVPLLYDYDTDIIYPPFVKSELSQNPTLPTDAMKGKLKTFYNISSASACCLAFNANLFKDLGLFDPHFRHYSEDLYFFEYLRQAGGQAFIVSHTKVHHYNSYDRAKDQEKSKILLLQRNGHTLFRKKTGQPYWIYVFKSYIKAILKANIDHIARMLQHDIWMLTNHKTLMDNSIAATQKRIHQQIAIDRSI